MKIEGTRPTASSVHSSGASGKAMAFDNGFSEKLRSLEESRWSEKLRSLLETINIQGERIAKNANIAEVRAYRRYISEFLEEAVGRSHRFSKESFLDRRGRHRVYSIVKKVDETLEELTQQVLREEKDHIRILKMLDDIRGLLLDILL